MLARAVENASIRQFDHASLTSTVHRKRIAHVPGLSPIVAVYRQIIAIAYAVNARRTQQSAGVGRRAERYAVLGKVKRGQIPVPI